MNDTLETIKTFTKSWTKPGTTEERLYLDREKAAAFIGLAVSRYKSGSIKHAELDGEEISNSQAHKIFSSMDKAYYDVSSGTWHHEYGEKAVDLIRGKLDRC